MMKDQNIGQGIHGAASISVAGGHSVQVLLAFINRAIPGFRSFYLSLCDSDRENRISDFLVYYFNTALLEEAKGFPPFNFGKNPTQFGSSKETDIGVVVLTKYAPPVTIIEFEAKRFSDSSNNKEYVCGKRGGMERFKRSQHGSHLLISGLFGYIQDSKYTNAAERINGWIGELAATNKDESIDWTSQDEQLVPDPDEQSGVTKWRSINARKGVVAITLLHYHINLCS